MSFKVNEPTPENPSCIVVFVHGLAGDARQTWTPTGRAANDENWLDWLNKANSEWLICSYAHESPMFGQTADLDTKANNFCQDIYEAFSSIEAPIFFVAHSFGGLLAKRTIMNVYDHDTSGGTQSNLAHRIAGVVFIATPHWPNNFAWTLQTADRVRSAIQRLGVVKPAQFALDKLLHISKTVNELADDKLLWKLRNKYRDVAAELGIRHRVLVEHLPIRTKALVPESRRSKISNQIFGGLDKLTEGLPCVVNYQDASPELAYQSQDTYVCLEDDHFSIAAPSSKEAATYRKVEAFIQRVVREKEPDPLTLASPATPPHFIVGKLGQHIASCLAAQPDKRVWFIHGPHGAGKTTLLSDFWWNDNVIDQFNYRHRIYLPVADTESSVEAFGVDQIAVALGRYFRAPIMGKLKDNLNSLKQRMKDMLSQDRRAGIFIDGLEAARVNERTQPDNEFPAKVWSLLAALGCIEHVDVVVTCRGGIRNDRYWKEFCRSVPTASETWRGLNAKQGDLVLRKLGINNERTRKQLIAENTIDDDTCLPADLVLAAKAFPFTMHERVIDTSQTKLDDDTGTGGVRRQRAKYINAIYDGYQKVQDLYDRGLAETGTGHLEMAILQVAAQAVHPISRTEMLLIIENDHTGLVPR